VVGLTTEDDPVKVEADLCALLPPAEWGDFSLRTILHGRRVCDAKKPRCGECSLEDLCPASLLPRARQRPKARSNDVRREWWLGAASARLNTV
jgi:adenine-specific DNA glycosylase